MSRSSLHSSRKRSTRRRNPNLLCSSHQSHVLSSMEAAFSATPAGLTDFGLARYQYLQQNVWSKYADARSGQSYVTPAERKRLAIAKWQQSEKRNAFTNSRLTQGGIDFGRFTSDRVLNHAAGIIASVLGTAPPQHVAGEFTGGASTRVKRSEIAIPQKFEGRPHATLDAYHWWGGLALLYPLWGQINATAFDPVIVDGSEMFTVPKNSQIDRVACKEPEANMFLQRGLGLFIRKRLKKNGIDLQDQSRNQSLARNGRRSKLATIDLSSASDTISRELVRRLLPAEWYATLDALRAKSVSVPNSKFRHNLEMFSSMGNGFTFELESLIFWALTRSVAYLLGVKGQISVYGDDIICPIPVGKMLVRVFAYCGFLINTKKSCLTGDLRESCGAHWLGPQSVTPFFFRSIPSSITDLIQIGNQVLGWCMSDGFPEDIPNSIVQLWGCIASLVPTQYYGGQSLERTDALVTGHGPRKILVPLTEDKESPQSGAYLWWHFWTHDKVLRDPIVTTSASREVGWVVRPNTSWHEGDLMWRTRVTLASFLERTLKVETPLPG